MNSHLIQRGRFRDVKYADIDRIDALIEWDYMGSAEFEFGALPSSLKRIMLAWDNYVNYFIEVQTQKNETVNINVYCLEKDFEEIQRIVQRFASKEHNHTKEKVGMWNAINNEGYVKNTNFWWDIENDWFAFFLRNGKGNYIDKAIRGNIERNKPAIR